MNVIECHIINGGWDTYFGYICRIAPPGSFVCVLCAEIVGFGVGVGREDRFLIQFLPIEFILFEILKIWQR